MTKVVHCKKEDYDIYIGRGICPKTKQLGKWGNPFKIEDFPDRIDCVHKYMYWLNTQPDLLLKIPELKGKVLGCWCYPKSCHGDILAKLSKSKWIVNWFSNMEDLEVPYIYQGITYKTSENFYQAMKLPIDRKDLRSKIASMSPYQAKKAIRDKEKFLWREDWNTDLALKVMEHILRYKFVNTEGFNSKALLETEDWEITEWNNWNDTFWGKNIYNREGENNLGKILMKLRQELRIKLGFASNKCECGQPGILRECPYEVDIYDKTSYCNCCSSCRIDCANGI